MNPLDPLDAAMMTAELVSNPMHVGAVLILSPPDDAGPDYVDDLHQKTLAGNDSIDPGCADIRIAVWTPAACGSGARWTR